ncbi:MAG: hypothetical protein ACJ8AT_22560 [Hyalangium sp.]|uniref:hypothetical protein n=1 Tax=Hyalangium sp. TaxID=2028555 RepID=UPI003899F2E1
MLAPLAANAARTRDPDRERQEGQRFEEQGVGGRAGIIDEINMGPTGMDVTKQRAPKPNLEGNQVLSGRVIEMDGNTLYVERNGVVVPLDMSALRVTKQPRVGQEIIATYAVDQTRNIALSLAGEVADK